jgi:putative RNA 2'-phosphotransferase
MDDNNLVAASKRLSLYLRHAPRRIGLTMAADGWVEVDELLAALAEHGTQLTHTELGAVVADNDKQPFAFDAAGTRIRASQGHRVPVDLGLREATSPTVLFHGTVERFLPAILVEGPRPMRRHAVQLSATVDTATTVGGRRGKPVVLRVDAATMAKASENLRAEI